MIDFQSSWPAAALSCRLGSPEGCGKFAGNSIPGKPSHYSCALKGRWKGDLSSTVLLSLCLRAPASLLLPLPHPCPSVVGKTFFYQTNPFRPVLGLSKAFKGIQSVSKPFKGIGECFLFSGLAAIPCPSISRRINPNQEIHIEIPTKNRPIPAKK
jgi:hypothetical protein